MIKVGRAAIISTCGRYRYGLARWWGSPLGRRVLFVMLNPSTADAEQDDPTIRRCIAFAHAWGMEVMEVVNMYALRATNPLELLAANDPVGPQNDSYIKDAAMHASQVVCAWGAHRVVTPERTKKVLEILRGCGKEPLCLRQTKSGAPSHPLYLPAVLRPVLFETATPSL